MLAGDELVHRLNREYRHVDRTTDVLAFPMRARGPQPPMLGDVIISVEQASRQAPRGDLEAELLRLLVHGLCHLLGFDHHGEREAARMRVEEQRLLQVVLG